MNTVLQNNARFAIKEGTNVCGQKEQRILDGLAQERNRPIRECTTYFKLMIVDCVKQLRHGHTAYVFTQEQIEAVREHISDITITELDCKIYALKRIG